MSQVPGIPAADVREDDVMAAADWGVMEYGLDASATGSRFKRVPKQFLVGLKKVTTSKLQ